MEIPDFLPEGWSQEQCSECQMVFALPQQQSRDKVREGLLRELDRHIRQNHIDLPSSHSDV